MKSRLSTLLALLFISSSLFSQSIDRTNPMIMNRPTGDEIKINPANVADLPGECSITVFTNHETGFRVHSGGLGTIVIRDIMKTGGTFKSYYAQESPDPQTGEMVMCFDLYDTMDLSQPPYSSECYSWNKFSEIIITCNSIGELALMANPKP